MLGWLFDGWLFDRGCRLCGRCASALLCGRCEAALVAERAASAPVERGGLSVYSWGRYRRELKRAIGLLKYGGEPRLGEWFGERLGRWWLDEELPRGGAWVSAVPLHPKRLRQRGYNQAERIARAFARRVGLRYLETLVRARSTPPLHGLSPRERARTLEGAFCPLVGLGGRPLILVDDILTTGTTLGQCREALGAAGSGPILGLVVARPPFGRPSWDTDA